MFLKCYIRAVNATCDAQNSQFGAYALWSQMIKKMIILQ